MEKPLSTADRALSVVVVDDTADARQLLGLALARGGFEVVGEAADGREGIDVVRALQPDVVLLDLAMPVLDGIAALPEIRACVPEATIVVLSGFGAQQMAERATAIGADGYVQKGAPVHSILDHLRTLCRREAESAPRPLRVVPETTAAEPADDPTPRDPVRPAAAVDLAPFGVVEIADDTRLRVQVVNDTAARLLGVDGPGRPLAESAPDLAAQVAYHRVEDDSRFVADLGGRRVRATLRLAPTSLLLYLEDDGPAAVEATPLRADA